jgi:mono/diheme cytochrome c family protein
MKRVFVIGVILIFAMACQKFSAPKNSTVISSHDEDESHEKGNNCMSCHSSAGYGSGFFTLAGSAYGNTNNADIEVYENPNGDPIMIVPYDLQGNAYTTEPLDFGEDGLYVAVRNAAGDRTFMEDKLYNGQCNLCHGTSIEERIEIE